MNNIIDLTTYKQMKQNETNEFDVNDDIAVRVLAFSVVSDMVIFLNEQLGFDPNEDLDSIYDLIHSMEFISAYIKRVNHKEFYLHESIDKCGKGFKLNKKKRQEIADALLEYDKDEYDDID